MLGWKFWLWVLSGKVLAVLFVLFFCLETRGKTLAQVHFLFTRRVLAFKKLDVEEMEEAVGGKEDRKSVE
jgi:hypothetical protein